MGRFAVIDTETNWADQVMSIGTIIADSDNFCPVDAKYHVITPEYQIGGMYDATLFIDARLAPKVCSRKDALCELIDWMSQYDVDTVFAYNASFDRNHLPELRNYRWHDIMRLAAYRQYNPKIPKNADCCSTGRLKRGYGVEPMLRLLSEQYCYQETHNAILDARDELEIMRLLGYKIEDYL